jgi:transcriptional regulator with XRE-family HTH domain
MNRLLYIARKAKGLTEKQIAKVLQIEESEYKELEHSLTDVTAKQALLLAKLYDIEAEQFIYTDGRKERVLKYSMDEISNYKQNGMLDNLPQGYYFNIVTWGNTALTLQAELNYAVYRIYELEQDNQALRILNDELKEKSDHKA